MNATCRLPGLAPLEAELYPPIGAPDTIGALA